MRLHGLIVATVSLLALPVIYGKTLGPAFRRAAPPDRVDLAVETIVFDGAELADKIDAQLTAAAAIWEKAGVVLKPAPVKRLSKADSTKHLAKGSAAKLDTYMGCIQRFDEPGFAERKELLKLKSRPGAVGIFVVKTVTQSQAEREFTQIYLDNDPTLTAVGRTLAHELGHLLLGEGHTGGERRPGPCDATAAAMTVQPKEPAPWTSGLMRNASTATDISAQDAVTARRAAVAIRNQ
jgi:hypothetical protein